MFSFCWGTCAPGHTPSVFFAIRKPNGNMQKLAFALRIAFKTKTTFIFIAKNLVFCFWLVGKCCSRGVTVCDREREMQESEMEILDLYLDGCSVWYAC